VSRMLTHKQIQHLTAPGRYSDGRSGLQLLIRRSGRRSWVYRYTLNGQRHDLSLGSFPQRSLQDARARAQAAHTLVESGVSPIRHRQEQRRQPDGKSAQKPTFQQFAMEWISTKRSEWRSTKHQLQWISSLATYAFPTIGEKFVSDITTDDLLAILMPIWSLTTETANRVRGRIEQIISAAKARGLSTAPNPAVWRGHLQTLLPRPNKVALRHHHRAMPHADIPQFVESLQGRDAMAALALEYLILTAARTGEVIGATRCEISGSVWTIPAQRMKAGRLHRVPLSQRATAILAQARALEPASDYLFSRRGRPLSNMAMACLLRRMKVDTTVHGFRSSFRDWVSDETAFSRELAEAALAHALGDRTEAAYRRGDALKLRGKLMQQWEDYCVSAASAPIQDDATVHSKPSIPIRLVAQK
jgi:integrase